MPLEGVCQLPPRRRRRRRRREQNLHERLWDDEQRVEIPVLCPPQQH
jgi:hypothetical protein